MHLRLVFRSRSFMFCVIRATPWTKCEKASAAGWWIKDRHFVKNQKYTLLSQRENVTAEGRLSLRLLPKAKKRLNVTYVLKEAFRQIWDYYIEGWAR